MGTLEQGVLDGDEIYHGEVYSIEHSG